MLCGGNKGLARKLEILALFTQNKFRRFSQQNVSAVYFHQGDQI
jgi:hypothetical protein